LPSLSLIVKSCPAVVEPSRRNENHVKSSLCRRFSVKRQKASILNTFLLVSNPRSSSTSRVTPNPEPMLRSVLVFEIKYPAFKLNFYQGVSLEIGFSANAGLINNNKLATKNTTINLFLLNTVSILCLVRFICRVRP
jgi:hypothetical protein